MRKISIFILLLGGVLFMRMGYSSSSTKPFLEEHFNSAVRHYDSGDYDKAILEINLILESGDKSGNLFYNAGNGYYKKGDIGKAIINYERAKLFIPRDSALRSNYTYVKSRMKQRDTRRKEHFFIKRLDKTFDYLTLVESLVIFNVIYCLAAFLIILSMFKKGFRVWNRVIAILLMIIVIPMTIPIVKKIEHVGSAAVVIASITDARFEPMEDGESNFPLYAGMRLFILKTIRGWHKVKRPDGKIGWVEAKSVELICK